MPAYYCEEEELVLAPRGADEQFAELEHDPPAPLSPAQPPTSAPAPPANTPRGRLTKAATGHLSLQREDLQALLTEHALAADQRSSELDDYAGTMLTMLATPAQDGNSLDPAAVLEMLSKLERIHEGRQRDLRRTVELLHRISGPPRPRVQILAATQVNVGTEPPEK